MPQVMLPVLTFDLIFMTVSFLWLQESGWYADRRSARLDAPGDVAGLDVRFDFHDGFLSLASEVWLVADRRSARLDAPGDVAGLDVRFDLHDSSFPNSLIGLTILYSQY
jgi:hypothetical protein